MEAEDEVVVPHQAGPKEKKCCFWSEAECQSQWLGCEEALKQNKSKLKHAGHTTCDPAKV